MGRTVTLVLVDGEGNLLGALPPFGVERPYWPEVGDVALSAKERHGVSVQVLRLVATELPKPHGGAVSYLAEVGEAPAGLEPIDPGIVEQEEVEQPLRAAYARAGGPSRSLAWARTVVGPVVTTQQRTWNLSAIWQLGGARRKFWLKQLPAFYPHEPAALTWLGQTVPDLVPRVIDFGPEGCELLADVPGRDLYDADLRHQIMITERAHRIQRAAVPAVDHLLGLGIPDRRGSALTAWIRAGLAGWVEQHPAAELLESLDERMAAVAGCGVPDTLVHGDADPGNVRADGDQLVFLDWSDCFIGHPAFDGLGRATGETEDERAAVLDAWAASWLLDVPGSEPMRAAELLRPVACLRAAAVYAEFVANIEPTERRYHEFDVPALLDAAVAADGLRRQ